MANNVTLPPSGTGDVNPKASTDQVSADSSQVQNVQLASVSGGVLTRNPVLPVSGAFSVTGTMPVSVDAAQEVDGHSANIGALADAASASTLTGLLKNIKAALAGTIAVSGTFWQATQPVSMATPVRSATATLANVSASASSVTLQASNVNRDGLVIVNDSTAILYVKFGSAASPTSYTYFLAGSVGGVPATLELPAVVYTGIVTGIWASAVGAARVTELT